MPKHRILCLCASIALCLLTALNAFAEPRIWLAPTGTNVWTVMGSGLVGIGGITINIKYDTTLTGLKVVNGSVVGGALVAANTNAPGIIRFGAVSANPFSKTEGDIAVISFGGGKGSLSILGKADLATASNNPQLVQVTPETQDTTDPSPSVGTTIDTNKDNAPDIYKADTPSNTTPSGQPVWLGGVTTPTAVEPKEQATQADIHAEPQRGETPEAAPEVAQADTERQPSEQKAEKQPKYVSYVSVMEKIRNFKGQLTPKELLALFGQTDKGYRQEPSVFLADGKGVLKVLIPLKVSTSASPNFAINREAQMASFPRVDGESWVIEIRPKKAAYDVVLSYFLEEVSTDIPLAVAPLLESYLGKPFNRMTDGDLAQFLVRTDSAKTDLSKDLNGDQRVDYIDDYIFAANYLVQTPKGAPSAPAKKSQDAPMKPKQIDSTKPSKK